MKNRTFAQEAKAMEYTINSLYTEKEYLEKRIQSEAGDTYKEQIRLQMVRHFINLYEGY